MMLRVEKIPDARPSQWKRWLMTPRPIRRAVSFYKWIYSPRHAERKFSHKEVLDILKRHIIHYKEFRKQDEIIYQDYLAGLSMDELTEKYMQKPEKIQAVINFKGSHLPQETVELTDEFLKGRLTQVMRDVDDAIAIFREQLEKAKKDEWHDEEKVVTEGGKFDGETKIKKRASYKRQEEILNNILKSHMSMFEAINQLVPKANINLNLGKDLASLPQDTLDQLIEIEKKRLKRNDAVPVGTATS